MKQLLEAIRAKYLCLHDWEVVSKTEYTDCWKILLKCKKCGKCYNIFRPFIKNR